MKIRVAPACLHTEDICEASAEPADPQLSRHKRYKSRLSTSWCIV